MVNNLLKRTAVKDNLKSLLYQFCSLFDFIDIHIKDEEVDYGE